MGGRGVAVLFDDEGWANVEEILAGLAEPEFELAGLRRALRGLDRVEAWPVREAIAAVFLTDHRACTFPWPDGATRETAQLARCGSGGVQERGGRGVLRVW